MTRHQHWLTALLFGTLLATIAPISAQTPKPPQDPKAAPEITGLTPTDLSNAPKPRAVTVNGRNFQEGLSMSVTTPGGAVVEYRSNVITDRRDTSFNAMVTLADAGNYEFVVVNPDGKTSRPFRIQVKTASALPAVTGIRPSVVAKGASPQTITVDGARFMAGLTVMVTDPAGNVQTIPSPDVSQVLPASFQITLPLEISGTYEIIVKNPDGAVSKTFTFEVQR
jgi:hypothetical protein